MTYKIPEGVGGLYAWYYVPSETDGDQLIERLTTMCSPSATNLSRLRFDYGLRFEAKGTVHASYGQRTAHDVVKAGVESNPTAVLKAFNTFMAPYFTRPLYIGISRSLRHRLYEDHYQQLLAYWEPTHGISRFLEGKAVLSAPIRERVEQIRTHLGVDHSFALEARTRNLHPSDLEVFYARTDWLAADSVATEDEHRDLRRSIERLLQLISLPTFGRI